MLAELIDLPVTVDQDFAEDEKAERLSKNIELLLASQSEDGLEAIYLFQRATVVPGRQEFGLYYSYGPEYAFPAVFSSKMLRLFSWTDDAYFWAIWYHSHLVCSHRLVPLPPEKAKKLIWGQESSSTRE